ncbi:MAG TPA: hypothetical protein VIQ81_04080 [Gammaproteobacteria bacterium]
MNCFYEPGLPYPHVYYPELYGVFIGFAKIPGGSIYLCSCHKFALSRYIANRYTAKTCLKGRWCVVEEQDFPPALIDQLHTKAGMSAYELLHTFKFALHICHRCNQTQPLNIYCLAMYGNLFKQHFGWYVKTHMLSFGNDEKSAELNVRAAFGFPATGKPHVTEKILMGYIKTIYPNNIVEYRVRLKELEGMELDIYLPELRLGIEYQGKQHYKPVGHWGGEEALRETKIRDRRKKRLCKQHGIKFVTFNYRQKLSIDYVEDKLRKEK